MSYAEFQADWERAAGAEYDRYVELPVAELIADVIARRYGECHQHWRAIAAKVMLAEAGWVLLAVLRGEDPYLVSSHAAVALLALVCTQEFEPVQLSAERPDRDANIDAVERMIRGIVKPPPLR